MFKRDVRVDRETGLHTSCLPVCIPNTFACHSIRLSCIPRSQIDSRAAGLSLLVGRASAPGSLGSRQKSSGLAAAVMRLFVNLPVNKVSSEEVQPMISSSAGQVQTMPSLEWDKRVWMKA